MKLLTAAPLTYLCFSMCMLPNCFFPSLLLAEPWKRHVVDQSSKGADGVRLADANRDGRLDVVTGWEEGGVIRVCLHPGEKEVTKPWPSVTVGKVKSAEDAVLVDLDGDGALDVVSCCEGKTRTMFIHWAPSEPQRYLQEDAWKTEAIPATQNKQMWMQALPFDVDGKHGIDLIVASKAGGASIGWLQSPADPRKVEDWTFHPWYQAGWIMSLESFDVDGDGDLDVVSSDRKGAKSGVLWLENPGHEASARHQVWAEHRIGAAKREVMFLALGDLDDDGQTDVVAASHNLAILVCRRMKAEKPTWKEEEIPAPYGIQNGKGLGIADMDLDGKLDLVLTKEPDGDRTKPGVLWMSRTADGWQPHDVSGPQGMKIDQVKLLALDGDGDLDILTCEERDNLGVIWYENPTRQPK